ncbi:MAG: 50S ribosomal protein L25 [Spirochaetes bacterium]|nr:50S ribosomal protein L25 [Spirochaetota bacterium]
MKLYPRLTKSTVINLKLDKNQYEVLIKDYEKDYIKDKFIHIDFYELKKGKPVHSFIPLNLIGNAIGIREGGILEKHLVELEIECLPKDIVSHLDVNIENMKINDTLHVRDLKIDKKHKMLSHIDEVIVHITGKIAEEVELAEVTEEAVEEAEEKVVDEETKTEK